MIIIFQILFVLFALFAIGVVLKRKKDGLLGPKGVIFWIVFWLIAILVVFWPNSTSILAKYLGIGRGSDLVIYVSLALMFFILFRLHVKIESIGRDITKVVRKESLEK